MNSPTVWNPEPQEDNVVALEDAATSKPSSKQHQHDVEEKVHEEGADSAEAAERRGRHQTGDSE